MIIFVYGEEPYLQSSKVKDILQKYPVDEMNLMESDTFGEDELVFLKQFPFIDDYRILVCRPLNLDDSVLEYLNSPCDTGVLILAPRNVDKRKKVFKELQKADEVIVCNKLSQKEVEKFISSRISLDRECMTALIDASGYLEEDNSNLFVLENMIHLLISYGNVNVNVVKELCGEGHSRHVFQITSAYVSKNYKKFIKEIENTPAKESIAILSLISSDVRAAYNSNEISNCRSAFKGFPKTKLADIYNILQNAILAIKSGTTDREALLHASAEMIAIMQ